MENTELIDKYLSGRMTDGEMTEFEQTLGTDPLLNKDFELQQAIIEGIKTTRMNELKASLNAIDVSGLTSSTSIWSVKTIAAATVIIVGGVASYFMFNKTTESDAVPTVIEESVENVEEINPIATEKTGTKQLGAATAISQENIASTENATALVEVKNASDADMIEEVDAIKSSEVSGNFGDFDDDNTNHSTAPENHMIDKGDFEHATIAIEIDNNKKKYSFHYQVKDNKLFLYGTFDKVYEVLEFKHGEKNDLFFMYDSKYYNILENQTNIVPLEEMSFEETLELKQKINNGNEAKSQ